MTEDAIFEWNMTQEEAEAFKIACIYQEEYLRICKEKDGSSFRRNTLPRYKDPRKSYLFKNCWKFRRETRGLLEANQIRKYIQANISIVKINNGSIEPNILSGEKSWFRWKVYERWVNKKEAEKASKPPLDLSTINPKIIREIDITKKFLYEKCEGKITKEKIKDFIDNKFMQMWIISGKVSKYYVVLSPYMKQLCDLEIFSDSCFFDLSLFKEKISTQISEYFKHEFEFEFKN